MLPVASFSTVLVTVMYSSFVSILASKFGFNLAAFEYVSSLSTSSSFALKSLPISSIGAECTSISSTLASAALALKSSLADTQATPVSMIKNNAMQNNFLYTISLP